MEFMGFKAIVMAHICLTKPNWKTKLVEFCIFASNNESKK
jgi:hypothetical protein